VATHTTHKEEKLCKEIKSKYKTLDKKTTKSNTGTKGNTTHHSKRHTFHPRVINNIEILFFNREMGLLHKGLK
jgi:hypothetical protein